MAASWTAATLFRCGKCKSYFGRIEDIISGGHQCVGECQNEPVTGANQTLTKNSPWNPESVKLLISQYSEHRSKFLDSNYSNKKVWNLIASSINDHGYQITGTQADEKWRNLKKTYRKISSNDNKTSAQKRRWEHFQDMDQILGSQVNSILPDASDTPTAASFEVQNGELIIKSVPEMEVSSEFQPFESQSPRQQRLEPNVVHEPPRRPPKRRLRIGVTPQWFREYERMEKEKSLAAEKRHKEKMEAADRRFEANEKFRNSLLAILSNLADKGIANDSEEKNCDDDKVTEKNSDDDKVT